MSRVLAVAQREAASFFRTPVGWVVIALFLALTGLVFALQTLRPGQPASMRAFFQLSAWLLTFVSPAVSMRLISEEWRTGTMESLMTAPVSDWQVVIGKFLGGAAFIVAMLAPTLVYAATLEALSAPDWGSIAAGYAGLLCLAMLCLAVGLLASALTANQVAAFLGALFALLGARIATIAGPRFVGPPLDRALFAASIDLRMADFAKGVIDLGNVVFFLAAAAWFVALAAVAVESRRWR